MRLLGLERAQDREVYDYAAINDFMIVSKDGDFHDLCLRYGPPPKVIWLNVGNCTTDLAYDQIDGYVAEIHAFATDPNTAILVIGLPPPALLPHP